MIKRKYNFSQGRYTALGVRNISLGSGILSSVVMFCSVFLISVMLEGKHEISVGMFDGMFISYLFVLNLLCSVSSFPMFCAVLRLFLFITGPGAIYARIRHSGAHLIEGTEITRRKYLTPRDSHVSAKEAAAELSY